MSKLGQFPNGIVEPSSHKSTIVAGIERDGRLKLARPQGTYPEFQQVSTRTSVIKI